MPVDFVDRLEAQLREAASVPPAVRRRRRAVAAARPVALAAAAVALTAGGVGAVAAVSAGGDGAGSAAGEGPPPGATVPAGAPPVPAPRPEDLVPAQLPTVRVLNGTTTAGLAGRLSRVVAGLGYRTTARGNAASSAVPRTQVHAGPGARAAARGLAAALGIPQSAVVPISADVAAQADGAQVVVVAGRRPRPPREHSTLLLRGPAGGRGQATAVLRGDGSLAVLLRTTGVSTTARTAAWVPGRDGWKLLSVLPPGAGRGGATVITAGGRRIPEGFLLTDEPGSGRPREPGTTLLTSKR